MVVEEERHLWLNLSGISLFGLFGTAVNTVVQMFREAKVQLAAFKRFSPHCSHGPLAPNNPADPQPGCRSWREGQNVSVLAHTPLPRS